MYIYLLKNGKERIAEVNMWGLCSTIDMHIFFLGGGGGGGGMETVGEITHT